MDVPGCNPTSPPNVPLITVDPVFVIVDPANTAKFTVDLKIHRSFRSSSREQQQASMNVTIKTNNMDAT